MSDQQKFDAFVKAVQSHIEAGKLAMQPIEMAGPGIRLTLTNGATSGFVDVSLLRIERNEPDFAPHVANTLISKLRHSKP